MENYRPLFNVPAAVVSAIALLGAVHLVRQVLPGGWDRDVLLSLAFIPARFTEPAEAFPGGSPALFTSFATHAAVHGDALHLMLNSLWLLVFGTAVAARNGSLRFIALFLACAALGASAFLIPNWGAAVPVIGASGAVAGLMGATVRVLFSSPHAGLPAAGTAPLQPLGESLRDRRVVAWTAVWFGLNGLAALGLDVFGAGGPIAWETHIGGYLGGILLAGFFERPSTDAAPAQ